MKRVRLVTWAVKKAQLRKGVTLSLLKIFFSRKLVITTPTEKNVVDMRVIIARPGTKKSM